MSDTIHCEDFPPDDARMTLFQALGAQISGVSLPEPEFPAARCLLAWRHGQPAARLSYEAGVSLHGVPGICGIVGHYEALDAAAGSAVLRHAQRLLVEAGASLVIGPMDGSTWGRYRLALPREDGAPCHDSPVFFAEPHNPVEYPEHFRRAGFSVAATYESRIVPDLGSVRPRAQALAERVARTGVTLRPLDLRRFDEDLHDLFRFCGNVFARHRYYRPIDFSTFRPIYLRLRPLLDPDLVRLAHNRDGRLIGFILAFPDVLSGDPGQPTRVVLKTVASAPEARGLGLGAHLPDEIHRLAYQKGYRAAIHALMHTANDSVKLSARYHSRLFRRYALYEWKPQRS